VLDILHCKLTSISNVPNSKEFLAGATDKKIIETFDTIIADVKKVLLPVVAKS
jgi:hypothetical protein